MATINRPKKGGKLEYIMRADFLEKWQEGSRWQWIAAGALLALFLVYNNTTAMRRIRQVSHLKSELVELRLEHVSISSTLMGATRISAIEERVREEQLDIVVPKTSPITLEQ